MSEPGISVTLKAHGGHDSPWIVVHGANTAEVSAHLHQLREAGAFTAIKMIANEFTNAAVEGQAVATVQQAFPGAQVISQPPPQAAPAQYQPPAQQAPPAYAPPAYAPPQAAPQQQYAPPPQQPQYAPTPPVQQGATPPCEKCGAPTVFKSGTSGRGPWSAHFCSSGNRDHAKFLN